MRAAEKKSTEDCPVKMKLVAPPLYVLTTNVRHRIVCFCNPGNGLCTGEGTYAYSVHPAFSDGSDCVQTLEKVKGVEVLKEACAACAESIAAKKGRMIVKEEARVVRAAPTCLSGHHASCRKNGCRECAERALHGPLCVVACRLRAIVLQIYR